MASKGLSEIISKISTCLESNVNICTFCQTSYGKLPDVYEGQNTLSLVEASTAPYFIIWYCERKVTDQEEIIKIGIGITLKDDNTTTVGRLTAYKGFKNLLNLTELVEKCLLLLNFKTKIESLTIESENFPIWYGKIIIEINQIVPVRG